MIAFDWLSLQEQLRVSMGQMDCSQNERDEDMGLGDLLEVTNGDGQPVLVELPLGKEATKFVKKIQEQKKDKTGGGEKITAKKDIGTESSQGGDEKTVDKRDAEIALFSEDGENGGPEKIMETEGIENESSQGQGGDEKTVEENDVEIESPQVIEEAKDIMEEEGVEKESSQGGGREDRGEE